MRPNRPKRPSLAQKHRYLRNLQFSLRMFIGLKDRSFYKSYQFIIIDKWASPCKTVSSSTCGQSDQCFQCPITESFGTSEYPGI